MIPALRRSRRICAPVAPGIRPSSEPAVPSNDDSRSARVTTTSAAASLGKGRYRDVCSSDTLVDDAHSGVADEERCNQDRAGAFVG